MAYGVLSMQVARALQEEFSQQGFDLLRAHGEKGIDSPLLLGKIRSWYGEAYNRDTILADLDMAVVSHEAFAAHDEVRAHALIEIEETNCKPKVILGDVVATLLGKGIKFQGGRDLQVGRWTTLIVLAHDPRLSGPERIPYLAAQAKYQKENLLTPNATLGSVVIETFTDYLELEVKLRQNITEVSNKRGAW